MKKSEKTIIILVSVILIGTALFLSIFPFVNRKPLKKLTKNNVESIALVKRSFDENGLAEKFRYKLNDTDKVKVIKEINKLKYYTDDETLKGETLSDYNDYYTLIIDTKEWGSIMIYIATKCVVADFYKSSLTVFFNRTRLTSTSAGNYTVYLGKIKDNSLLDRKNIEALINEYIREDKNEVTHPVY